MTHEIVRTRAGHLAMRDQEVGEVMHPGVGPLAEAQALYVRQSRLVTRLEENAPAPLVVFDVGLGAGSNAAAAHTAARQTQVADARLELVSFERDLGALTLALQHPDAFGLTGEAGEAARALLATEQHQSTRVRWRLLRGELLATLAALVTSDSRADVVFWDPFSPRANPTLWTVHAFTAARRVTGSRGTLFTYSASTATRVALLLAGWAVGVGDAVGSKAETTAAAIRIDDLARPLDAGWSARLARPDVPLPDDAPDDFVERISALPQFRRR